MTEESVLQLVQHPAGCFKGIVSLDPDNLIVNPGVKYFRDKSGADSLDRVGTFAAAGEDRRCVRLNSNGFEG